MREFLATIICVFLILVWLTPEKAGKNAQKWYREFQAGWVQP